MTAAIFALLVALAAVNGANDVPKGVATLAGAGVTRYRTALLWGTATTAAGCLVSLGFAERLTKLFSTGIVTVEPTPAFALAVLFGSAAWVALATATRLPVSTTHALVGGLVGAGLGLAPGAVAWGNLPGRVAQPLLLSVGVAYLASLVLNLLPRRVPECVCVDVDETQLPPVSADAAGGTLAASAWALPSPRITTGTSSPALPTAGEEAWPSPSMMPTGSPAGPPSSPGASTSPPRSWPWGLSPSSRRA